MIIRDFNTDALALDVPELVQGRTMAGAHRTIPGDYTRFLFEWISDNRPALLDADVVVTSGQLDATGPGATLQRKTGPLPRLSTYPGHSIGDAVGWYLRVSPADGSAPVKIDLYDTGLIHVRDTDVRPIEETLAAHAARQEAETAPAYRLQAATGARQAAEAHADQARRVQAAAIRHALGLDISVQTVAEQTGLSRERVYQIRDDRR